MLLIPFAIMLSYCQNPVGNNMPKVYSNGFVYLVDTTTGLCYEKTNSTTYNAYEVTSMTCVPCDSLKRIGLIK